MLDPESAAFLREVPSSGRTVAFNQEVVVSARLARRAGGRTIPKFTVKASRAVTRETEARGSNFLHRREVMLPPLEPKSSIRPFLLETTPGGSTAAQKRLKLPARASAVDKTRRLALTKREGARRRLAQHLWKLRASVGDMSILVGPATQPATSADFRRRLGCFWGSVPQYMLDVKTDKGPDNADTDNADLEFLYGEQPEAGEKLLATLERMALLGQSSRTVTLSRFRPPLWDLNLRKFLESFKGLVALNRLPDVDTVYLARHGGASRDVRRRARSLAEVKERLHRQSDPSSRPYNKPGRGQQLVRQISPELLRYAGRERDNYAKFVLDGGFPDPLTRQLAADAF